MSDLKTLKDIEDTIICLQADITIKIITIKELKLRFEPKLGRKKFGYAIIIRFIFAFAIY
jgi:hypothetical protein